MSLATTPAPTPRRILVCVSGMSPAIVTETLFALVTQQDFIPDEVHVITTLKGRELVQTHLLHPETGHFHAFLREYLPGRSIRFDDRTLHVIGESPDGTGTPLSDITTDGDNRAAANTIYRVLRQLKATPGTHLHASVAGGRKSMSFYMGQAFSLVAEAQDRLSHVLVNDPFENPAFQFFYPPRTHREFSFVDKQTCQTQRVNSANAHIQLADLSVIKLGSKLGKMPEKAKLDFDFAIRLAQAALEPPQVKLVLERRSVEVLGEVVTLTSQRFMVLALHALARVHADELPNQAALLIEDLPSRLLYDLTLKENKSVSFTPTRAKMVEDLHKRIGQAADWLTIEPTGVRRREHERLLELRLPAHCLTLEGFDEEWWPLLRRALIAPGGRDQPERGAAGGVWRAGPDRVSEPKPVD